MPLFPHLEVAAASDHGDPAAQLVLPHLTEVAPANLKGQAARHVRPHLGEAAATGHRGPAVRLATYLTRVAATNHKDRGPCPRDVPQTAHSLDALRGNHCFVFCIPSLFHHSQVVCLTSPAFDPIASSLNRASQLHTHNFQHSLLSS